MPGVPRSRGCKTCKLRRVKCDETWPECTQCKRRKHACPGPTALIKFINNGDHSPAAKDTGGEGTAKVPPPGTLGRLDQTRTPDSTFKFHRMYSTQLENGHNGRLHVTNPRPQPTTLAERVGARLLSDMQRGPQELVNLQMSYLPQVPQRLHVSSCLRDTVDLFCAALADLRRRQPRPLIAMPQYGKALGSLRRALGSGDALKPETLATITMLERINRIFDRSRTSKVHLHGIVQVMGQKGPPDLGDELDVAVANELHGLLVSNWDMPGHDFLYRSPWKGALDQCSEKSIGDLGPIKGGDLKQFMEYIKVLHPLVRDFYNAQLISPGDEEAKQGHERLFDELEEIQSKTGRMAAETLKRCLQHGIIQELDDPEYPMGTRYHFVTAAVGVTYIVMRVVQMAALRTMYDVAVSDGLPNAPELDGKYRELCADMGKIVPYLRLVEPIVAFGMLTTTYLSYEYSEDRVKTYMLDTIQLIDRDFHRFPTDRLDLERVVIDTGTLLVRCKVPFEF